MQYSQRKKTSLIVIYYFIVACSRWYLKLNSHIDVPAILVICLCWYIFNQKEANSQKFSRKSRDERQYSNADDHSGMKNAEQPQSTASKSFGTQRKNAKGFMGTLKDQQVSQNLIPVRALIFFFFWTFYLRHIYLNIMWFCLYIWTS